ncbi:hypothetical protein [Yersinia sp. 2545 StPb PI]|uniref:hypothetical protein n=1 Tax=Yersinia sp. 2545 StPb PI TaxID=3117410 RepID=UPI003FA49A8C
MIITELLLAAIPLPPAPVAEMVLLFNEIWLLETSDRPEAFAPETEIFASSKLTLAPVCAYTPCEPVPVVVNVLPCKKSTREPAPEAYKVSAALPPVVNVISPSAINTPPFDTVAACPEKSLIKPVSTTVPSGAFTVVPFTIIWEKAGVVIDVKAIAIRVFLKAGILYFSFF